MNTCEVRSHLLWNTKDITNLAQDIFKIAGPDKAKEFKIILTPVIINGNLFKISISGPEEYKDVVQKMSNQEKV